LGHLPLRGRKETPSGPSEHRDQGTVVVEVEVEVVVVVVDVEVVVVAGGTVVVVGQVTPVPGTSQGWTRTRRG